MEFFFFPSSIEAKLALIKHDPQKTVFIVYLLDDCKVAIRHRIFSQLAESKKEAEKVIMILFFQQPSSSLLLPLHSFGDSLLLSIFVSKI